MDSLLRKLILGAYCVVATAPLLCEQYEADYVVVGMGAAGAGVAKLLSDDHHYSVIGLEAGRNQDNDTPIKDSEFAPLLEPDFYAKYFYQQEQIPEEFADGNVFHYTTGYLWGGGSSINGEQYVQGSDASYKRWERLLGSTWSVHKIRKTFKHLEKFNGISTDPDRGEHGPVDIRQAPVTPTSMALKFVTATSQATGFQEILDYNNPKTPMGPFTRWQLFQKPNGDRESSSTAYLKGHVTKSGHPIGKRQLQILSKAVALRILFDKHNKAIGVEFEREGKCGKVFAKKKVIVCAGVFSPKLLKLSGIGPKKELEENHIDIVYRNENVGKNLGNHPISVAVFTANPADQGVPVNDPDALYVGGAFLPNPTPGSDQSIRDVQLIGTPGDPGTFIIAALLVNPKSKGFVDIQSKDQFKPVLATDNLFANPEDFTSFKNIFRVYIQNIAATLAAIDPLYQLVAPTLDVINDDELLEQYIFDNLDVAHHWMGSCRMAPRHKGGVVDKHGHVYGVKNLIVADDSIAPYMNDGNTAAPAMMIGRAIAEQIIAAEAA